MTARKSDVESAPSADRQALPASAGLDCPAPCSACCHQPLIRQHNGMWTCGNCGREWTPEDKYWCAWCGKWGTHQSGWCADLAASLDHPNAKDERHSAAKGKL